MEDGDAPVPGESAGDVANAARERPASARLLIIGDEILSGEVRDQNAGFLAAGLTSLGIRLDEIRVVADRRQAIVRALGELLVGEGLVLVSGGIGPTHDDVTREAVAEALDVRCRRHPEAERRLREGYGPTITPAEVAMADLPAGADLLPGLRTGVFGFGIGRLLVLPGVPHLLQDIFHALAERWSGGAPPQRVELVTGRREGHVADGLRAIQQRFALVSIGSYPFRTDDGYRLRVVLRSANGEALARAQAEIEALFEAP